MMRQDYIGSLEEGKVKAGITAHRSRWCSVGLGCSAIASIVSELLPFSYMLSYLRWFEPQPLLHQSPSVLLWCSHLLCFVSLRHTDFQWGTPSQKRTLSLLIITYHVQVLLAQLSNISSAQFRDSGDRKVVFEKLRSLRRLNVVLIFLVMQITFRSCDNDASLTHTHTNNRI